MIQYSIIVDCQWSSWSQGRCSKGCGGGQRTNSRHKWVNEEYGGTCSGQSNFIDSCNTHPCPGMQNFIITKSFILINTITEVSNNKIKS